MISKFQCGFSKNYSMQQYVFSITENLQQSLDKDDAMAGLLIDLSFT